jgi:rhodanese-related sulfurtransferase
LIDVCSPAEFAAGHLSGATNIPLEQLATRTVDVVWATNPVILCQSGQRALLAQRVLAEAGVSARVLDGGLSAWSRASLPLVRSVAAHWSLERQVRLAAGILVSTGILLSLMTNRVWIGLSAFVGLGLVFSGLSGLCPMGNLLGMLPWNQPRVASSPVESPQPGAGCSL